MRFIWLILIMTFVGCAPISQVGEVTSQKASALEVVKPDTISSWTRSEYMHLQVPPGRNCTKTVSNQSFTVHLLRKGNGELEEYVEGKVIPISTEVVCENRPKQFIKLTCGYPGGGGRVECLERRYYDLSNIPYE